MSTPERHGADHSSPPFQSAQPQGDKNYDEEELLKSSGEESPRSQDDLRETSILEDAFPAAAVDDDASNRDVYSPERDALGDIDQVSPPPGGSADDRDSDILPSRPNKYHGPLSTWRNWTAAERELAASLQQLTANDLSLHLYNAFHLKIRSRRIRRQQTQQRGRRVEGVEAWTPPKVWTAWPLPPDIVPREGCVSSWEDEKVPPRQNHVKTHSPSRPLKELLVSYVLRKAKERFWAREWEYDEPNTSDDKHRGELGSQTEHSRGSSEDGSFPAHEASEPVGSLSARSEAGYDTEGESQNARADQQVEDPTSPMGSRIDHAPSNLVPEVMVDDDRASEILEPILSHVLAKLDGLLMGLHTARSAYTGLNDSASESQQGVDEPRQSSRGKRKRSNPRQIRGRNRSSDESVVESEVHGVQNVKAPSVSPTRSYPTSSSSRKTNRFQDRKTRLGVRDWSDIIGIASMIGWEAAVVEKAATRCAALFEEGISFRTLTEGKDEATEISYLPGTSEQPGINEFGKRFSERSHENNFMGENERLIGGVHVDGFLQPVKAENHWKRYRRLRQSREE